MSLLNCLPPVEQASRPETINADSTNSVFKGRDAPNPFARDILFVATNLDSWAADDIRFGHEVMLDVCYRQFDASYYAWLRDKMTQVKQAHDSGKMKPELFQGLRYQFNTIHEWAVKHIGEEALLQAVQTTSAKSFVPPSERTFTAYRKAQDDAWEAHQRQTAQSGSSQSEQAQKLEYVLATRGYACIKSSIVEDIVVFVRDDSVVVPDKWTDKVRFMMDELSLMIGSSSEAVKQIYEVKHVFGGKVVPAGDDPFGSDTQSTVSAAQQTLFPAAAGTK
ncbi:MAG: hypothetical protein ABFD83_14375 [Armatimonadota bacterium]